MTMDKKDMKYFLDSGFDYLNGCLKEGCSDDERDTLYKDYYKLEETLYNVARNKLSMTDLVRLETRCRATLKRLNKRFAKAVKSE